jgi:YD repeat-containing protein
VVTGVTGPDGASSRIDYDGFGRLYQQFAPDPTTGNVSGAPAVTFSYFVSEGGPTQRVMVQSQLGSGQTDSLGVCGRARRYLVGAEAGGSVRG